MACWEFYSSRKTMDDDGRHLSCAVEWNVNNLFWFTTQVGLFLLIMAGGRCQIGTVNKQPFTPWYRSASFLFPFWFAQLLTSITATETVHKVHCQYNSAESPNCLIGRVKHISWCLCIFVQEPICLYAEFISAESEGVTFLFPVYAQVNNQCSQRGNPYRKLTRTSRE